MSFFQPISIIIAGWRSKGGILGSNMSYCGDYEHWKKKISGLISNNFLPKLAVTLEKYSSVQMFWIIPANSILIFNF